jgi:hypothetical protein
MKFEIFIEQAITNSSFIDDYSFGDIDDDIAELVRIKSNGTIRLFGFERLVNANEIRHIKNRHPEDFSLINNITDIFNNFDEFEKSIIKDTQTGKTVISLVLRKKYANDIIQCVELINHRNKKLYLKTFFKK